VAARFDTRPPGDEDVTVSDPLAARASSFGDDPEQYDRTRPGYPDALYDDLSRTAPGNALDVGCGTGRVAIALSLRGWRVLGVERDDRMAAVARRAGIEVVSEAFETFDAGSRRFGLVTAGQTWHWLDPQLAPARAAELLRPGGTLALFWNLNRIDPELQAELDGVYRRVAPAMGRSRATGTLSLDTDGQIAALAACGRFSPAELRRYPWSQVYSTAEWLDLLPTHSDHRVLPAGTLEALLAEIGSTIDRLGGVIPVAYETVALLAAPLP